MAFPADVVQAPNFVTGAAQSVSLLFNASQLAAGAGRPSFRSTISPRGLPPPGVPIGAVLDLITLDVTLQETHTANSEVTEHPVEQGADITDHVRPKPVELRMEGLVTSTPLDESMVSAVNRAAPGLGLANAAMETAQGLLRKSAVTRTAFDALRALRDNAALCAVFTPYRTYTNMVAESLVVTREPGTGEALHFIVIFREVILVSSGATTINLPPSAQPARDTGTQGTAAATGKLSTSTSVLYKNINSATGGGIDRFRTWVTQ